MAGQASPKHHRSDTTPAPSLWTRTGWQGQVHYHHRRQVELAAPEARALGIALGDEPPPCASDPESWFDTSPAAVALAEDRCMDCPGAVACGAYADALKVKSGVWGGTRRDPSIIEEES